MTAKVTLRISHTREGGYQVPCSYWVPAFAGTTKQSHCVVRHCRLNTALRNVVKSFLAAWLIVVVQAAMAGGQYCTSVKYPAPSGPNNDIEFIFDKPYPCGQFANGDWWVSGGFKKDVTITQVLPESHDGMHGMEVNPRSKNTQGFDFRISGYNATLNAATPFKVKNNASVVKAVSVPAETDKCRPCLKYAAVLTILASPLYQSKSYLRPGYYGNRKSLNRLPQDIAQRIPKYTTRCCGKVLPDDFERIAQRYQGVQLDHIEGWVGRNLHPIDNMPDYGTSIAVDNAVSVLRMLLDDFDYTNITHKNALVNYLQSGVDFQAMADDGVKWPANGGHGNGRKLPILFTGKVLNRNSFMKSLSNTTFSEDHQVYRSAVTGIALFGAPCTDRDYWMTIRYGRGSRDCRDPYGYIDGGGHEIGSAYQVCCTSMPWKYTALAIRMLGLTQEWGHDSFLEYVDRWVNEGVIADPDPCAPYNQVPDDYGRVYGPGPRLNCITGAGRYREKHGSNIDAGHYRNTLGDQMWSYFRNDL